MIAEKLLDILVCPVCKGALETDRDVTSLLCGPCGLTFPIRDGIPVMLVNDTELPGE